MLFGLAYHAAYVGVLWAMLERFPSLGGWVFADVLFLYALWACAHGVYSLSFGKLGWLSRQVRDGRFDGFLTRPASPLFQAVTHPEGIVLDDLVVGLVLLAIAQGQAGLVWTLESALLVPAVVAGAALLKGALLLAISSLSFWVVRMDGARLLLETVEIEVVRFPLTVFPSPLPFLFTFVLPFAFISFLPAQLLLDKESAGLLAPELGYLTPGVGAAAFGLAVIVWRAGLARYQSTGS